MYVNKVASKADGIVVINRVKPHTAFRGKVESGIMKMMAIGLGKQRGAEACHQLGFEHMGKHIIEMSQIILEQMPILFGVATVENACDKVTHVEALLPIEI